MNEPDKYLCFACLNNSDTPRTCSRCGATIEEFDPEQAVLVPPCWGRFIVNDSDLPLGKSLAIVSDLKSKYSQITGAESLDASILVRSTKLGYEDFLQAAAAYLNTSRDELAVRIQFVAD